MSELENSTNNQLPPPIAPKTLISLSHQPESGTQSYIRDPRFYYRDGNTVFLAGNTLFKFQASLINADADAEDYEFSHIMRGVGTSECFEGTDKPGIDDAHPIVLPDVAPDEFRAFLTVVFGGVINDTFLAFLKALRTPSGYSPILVSRLTDIGYLACRFGMKRLDAWSQTQIHTILKRLSLVARMHKDNWDARATLRFVKYVQNTTVTDYCHTSLELMRHIISDLIQEAYELDSEKPQGKIIDVCTALYKENDILINSPGFFGFIFAVIVSLGHQSGVWDKSLTREDRRVLYVAQATFTCLVEHPDLELGWLTDPAAIQGVCVQCSHIFKAGWQDAFAKYDGLKSRAPLEDIRHVVTLAEYRYYFRSLGRAGNAIGDPCGCDVKVIGILERRIETLYCGLTNKYKLLAETV